MRIKPPVPDPYEHIHGKFVPFFYRTCLDCKDKVKGEPVWQVIIHEFHGFEDPRVPKTKYICFQCAPDIAKANKIRKEHSR